MTKSASSGSKEKTSSSDGTAAHQGGGSCSDRKAGYPGAGSNKGFLSPVSRVVCPGIEKGGGYIYLHRIKQEPERVAFYPQGNGR